MLARVRDEHVAEHVLVGLRFPDGFRSELLFDAGLQSLLDHGDLRCELRFTLLLLARELRPSLVIRGRSKVPQVRAAHWRHVVKVRQEAVVLGVQDRVAFVRMAASTSHRHAQHDFRRRLHDVVEPVVASQQSVSRFIVPDAEPVVARRRQRFGGDVVQFVASKLLDQKAVVRFVALERVDDVVAKAPSFGFRRVAFVAMRLGIADEIEPMPTPLLSVLGRLQQPINQLLVSLRRAVRDEVIDVLSARRQAGEVVAHATNQSRFLRRLAGRKSRRFELCEDVGIDRITHPVGSFDRRRIEPTNRLIGPIRRVSRLRLGLFFGFDAVVRSARPRKAALHPLRQHVDLLASELAGRRHLKPIADVVDGLHEHAFRRLLDVDRKAQFAALEHAFATGQPEAAANFRLAAMTLEAVRFEHRQHVLLKELDVLGRELFGIGLVVRRSEPRHADDEQRHQEPDQQ